MGKRIKQIFIIILTLILIISACPVSITAADKFYSEARTLLIQSNIEEDAGMSEYATNQGACTDGTYAYYALQGGSTKILKYDLCSYELIAKKTYNNLGHANDMAYNSDTDEIIVAHNEPNYNTVTILDAETLKVKKNKKLPLKIYSIAYNNEREQYVVGISGSYNFALLNSDFKVVEKFKGENTGYTRQGCDCDDEYIYFSQSGGDNIIAVYDYDGEHIKNIDIDSSKEIENIFHTGRSFYITLHYYGNYVYRAGLSKAREIKYKITYDANGGDGEMEATNAIYGKDNNLDKCTFTKDGYHFGGWIARKNSFDTYLGKRYNSDESEWMDEDEINEYTLYEDEQYTSTTTKNGGITLKAFWISDTYNIKYDAEDADNYDKIPQQIENVKYDDEIIAKENKYEKNGYVFAGYKLYRNVDDKYYGYVKGLKRPRWVDKSKIDKYYLVEEGQKLSKLTYDEDVSLISTFRSAFVYNESNTTLVSYIGHDTSVIIPEKSSVFAISGSAFNEKDEVSEVTINKNIQKIEDDAFTKCKNLRFVYFNNYLPKDLSDNAFSNGTRPGIYLIKDDGKIFLGWYANGQSMYLIKSVMYKINNESENSLITE